MKTKLENLDTFALIHIGNVFNSLITFIQTLACLFTFSNFDSQLNILKKPLAMRPTAGVDFDRVQYD